MGRVSLGTTWSVRASLDASDDAGLTLVEALIGLLIVSVGVLALLGELVGYMRGQVSDKAHAGAVRLASTQIEDARNLPYTGPGGLSSMSSYAGTNVGNGITYSYVTAVQMCLPTDPATSCTTPSANDPSVARVSVTVSWTDSGRSRQVVMSSNVTNTSPGVQTAAATGSLGSLIGGTPASPGVSVGTLAVSPTTVGVSSSGTPTSNVTVTLSTVGLGGGATVPLTWSDDNGSHQTTMSSSNGGSTWTATVNASSITKTVAAGQTGTVKFAATVPGGGVATANLTLSGAPTFVGTCSVVPNPIVFQVLTTKTSLAETLTCTTAGLTSADNVSVSYPTSSSTTATGTLTSSNGNTWTVTLPVGTRLKGAPSETFTFSLSRVSDGLSGTSQSVTVLAA